MCSLRLVLWVSWCFRGPSLYSADAGGGPGTGLSRCGQSHCTPLSSSWGETVSTRGKTGVTEEGCSPWLGCSFRLWPSPSKEHSDARACAVQVLGSGSSGRHGVGWVCPGTIGGPCDYSRQAETDGREPRAQGRALVTVVGPLRTSAFLLPWSRGGAAERCSTKDWLDPIYVNISKVLGTLGGAAV